MTCSDTTGFPSAGALLEELGREAQRGVRFRRLCGLGPQEGWLKAPPEDQHPGSMVGSIHGTLKWLVFLREHPYEKYGC